MRVRVTRLVEFTYYVDAKDVDEAVQWVTDGNVVPVTQALLDMKATRVEDVNNESKHI